MRYYSEDPVTGSHADRRASLRRRPDFQHQRDLTSNAAIGNNYNLPGGALGSLATNAFSLDGYSAGDKPTLYFNYFLETENFAGERLFDGTNEDMRDSARVFVSNDGGATWELVGHEQLVAQQSRVQRLWTPNCPSSSRIPRRRAWPATTRCRWSGSRCRSCSTTRARGGRPASILSNYAGEDQLMLRFDFSTAGTMNDASLGFVEDVERRRRRRRSARASASSSTPGNAAQPVRGLNNDLEGFYVDDIIIGFAERGEMVDLSRRPTNQGFRDLATDDSRTDEHGSASHLRNS